MTQAQLELQNQLEQSTNVLTTQLHFNDSPILFSEAMNQDQSTTTNEQIEHKTTSTKDQISPRNSSK